MIIFFIVIASMSMYMLIGYGLVKFDTPHSISRNVDSGDYVSHMNRRDITSEQWLNQFLWPIMIWIRITQNTTIKAIDAVDPSILQAAKRKIRELEYEADQDAKREEKRIEEAFARQIKLAELQNKAKTLGIEVK